MCVVFVWKQRQARKQALSPCGPWVGWVDCKWKWKGGRAVSCVACAEKELQKHVQYYYSIKCFSMFLKASCTAWYYHPNDLGLLFLKDSEGKTACERASKNYGNDKTMAAIGDIIPFDDPT